MNPLLGKTQIFSFLNSGNLLQRRLGTGQKGICILLHQPDLTLPKEETTFLHKVLQAIQLDAEQDTWIFPVRPAEQLSFNQLPERRQIQVVLVFGLSPQQLGLQFQVAPFHPCKIQGIRFLFSPELSEISASQTAKKQLWEALKGLFFAQ